MPGINRGPWRWGMQDQFGNPIPLDPTYHQGLGWDWTGKRTYPYFDWQVTGPGPLETIFFDQIISLTANRPPLDLNYAGNNNPHTIEFSGVDGSAGVPWIRAFNPYVVPQLSTIGSYIPRDSGTSTLDGIPGNRYVSVGLISDNNVVGFTMSIPPERFAVMAYDPLVGFQVAGQIDHARISGVNVNPTLGLSTWIPDLIDLPGVGGWRSNIEGIFLGDLDGALGYDGHYPDNTWIQIEAVGYQTIVRRNLTWDEIESGVIWVPMERAPINLIIRTYHYTVTVVGGEETVTRAAVTNSWAEHVGREVTASNLPAGNPFISLNSPRSFRLPISIVGVTPEAMENTIMVFDPIRVGAPGFATFEGVINPMDFERDELTGEFRTTVIDGRIYYLMHVITEDITRPRAYVRMIDNDMVEDGELPTGDPWYFFDRDAENLEFRYNITAAGTQWAPSLLTLPLQRLAGTDLGPGGTNPAGVPFARTAPVMPSAVAANNLTISGNPASMGGGSFNSLNAPATAPSTGVPNFRIHIVEPTRSNVHAFRVASFPVTNLTGEYEALQHHRLINTRDIGLAGTTNETFFWVECLRGIFLPSDVMILGNELADLDDFDEFDTGSGAANTARTDVAIQVRDRVNVPMRRPVNPIEIYVRVVVGPPGVYTPFPNPSDLLVTAGLLPSAIMLAPTSDPHIFRLFAEGSPDFDMDFAPALDRTIHAQAPGYRKAVSSPIDFRDFPGTHRYITLRMIPLEYILEATVYVPDGFPLADVDVTLDGGSLMSLNPPGSNVGNRWSRRTSQNDDFDPSTDHGSRTVGFILARPDGQGPGGQAFGQVSGIHSGQLVRPDGYLFTVADYNAPESLDEYGNRWARRRLALTSFELEDDRGGIHGIIWHHALLSCECDPLLNCGFLHPICPTRPPETSGPLRPLPTASVTKICPSGSITTIGANDPRWMGGYYEFLNLEDGYYTLIVSAPGFITQVRENVQVINGQMAVEDFTLLRGPCYTLIARVYPRDVSPVTLTLDGTIISAGDTGVYVLDNNIWIIIRDTPMAGQTATATTPLFRPASSITGPHDASGLAHVVIRLDTIPFIFYKTDMGIYDDPMEVNFLSGAVFQLFRQVWEYCDIYPGCDNCDDCGWVWVPIPLYGWEEVECTVCTDTVECPNYDDCRRVWAQARWWEEVDCEDCTDTTECNNYDDCRRVLALDWFSAVSDEDGRVELSITQSGTYKLVEVIAPRYPQQFWVPDGHWIIQLGNPNRRYIIYTDITTVENNNNVLPVPEFIRVGDNLVNFLAVGNRAAEIDFVFYKTDERLYENPRVINMLGEAVFRLYRQVEYDSELIWEAVLLDPDDPNSFYDVTSGDGTGTPLGQVTFTLSFNGVYKIRERVVPLAPAPGIYTYRLPPGYWIITVVGGVLVPTDISGVNVYLVPSDTDDYRIPPFVWYDDNWHVGNLREWRFEFHKTDYRLYYRPAGQVAANWLLPGAHFRLFRFIGTGQPGADEKVTQGISGNVGTRWEEVTLDRSISTGLIGEPIWYFIDPRFTYQLVEVMPPAGFQPPWGQWRIWIGEVPLPSTPGQIGIRVETIGRGPLTPDFTYESGNWFLGNFRVFELPLAGGRSANMYNLSGLLVISVAMLFGGMIFVKRAKAGLRSGR